MFLLRSRRRSSSGSLCAILLAVVAVGAAAPAASAQTGIIAFQDHCSGRLYAMRGDGAGRIALPLPPLPAPAGDYRYWGPRVLDVTTSGPVTVFYYVGISRRESSALPDVGLYAVQLTEVDGVLVPDALQPVRLRLPESIGIAGVNPNAALHGSFSSAGGQDRLALVAQGDTASVLMTVRVDRDDSTSRVTGLSDLVVVGDLYSLGVPDPRVPTNGFTGFIDYSPDGSSIVASIYYDLWVVHLDAAHGLQNAEQLTVNTSGVAEWNPAYSPDGTRIAYTAGPITTSGPQVGGVRSTDIYALAPATGAATRVTVSSTKGKSASSVDNAMWAADSAWIGFTAFTSSTPRRSPCSTLVNSEIFLIDADGSGTASLITNTNGTSVEARPKWGW